MTDTLARPAPTKTTEPWAAVLAFALAGAGIIHLAMVPSHAAQSTLDAVGFAVVGWGQLGLALAVLVRPSRLVSGLAVASSVAFIGLWSLSRARGLPVGGHAGEAEAASLVDLTAVGLETVAALVGAFLLLRSESEKSVHRNHAPLVAFGAVIALLLTTVALASPSARDHAARGDGHETLEAADGHAHGGDAEGQTGGAPHEHGADEVAVTPAAAEAGHFGDSHHHTEYEVQYEDLPDATQDQVDITREFVELYPTGADAAANGWYRASDDLPGIAAHYYPIRIPGATTPEQIALRDRLGFDPWRPILLYDGETPDSPIVGVSYLVPGLPDGFTGNWDVWHEHLGVCLENSVAIADIGDDPESKISMTPEVCEAEGGRVMSIEGMYMVHVWSVPGFESTTGIFSHDHPELYPDG